MALGKLYPEEAVVSLGVVVTVMRVVVFIT